MARYILRRLLWTAFVIVAVSFITFLIYFVMPPNDYAWESFTHGGLTAHASTLTRHVLGLDRPFWFQYGAFAKRLFLGDRYGWPGFWMSFQTRAALKPIILSKAVVTAQLALGAALVWLAVGIPIGILSALRPRSLRDRVAMGFALVGVSTPVFLLGVVMLYVFWNRLHVAPGTGYTAIGRGFGAWLGHMIVPWIVLAMLFAGFYARMTRASLMETMNEDYVRTARAKGLSERRVVVKHGLRASLLPVVTMFGMDMGQLFGGAVVTERVFNLPGLGAFAVESVRHADLYAIIDITLVLAFAVAILNLLVDVSYAFLDPRIRHR
ncbi:MAG TPA: ABC transporter permease [Actinobacteria bacterium]|nr:ABC transporter permease [Actinomycetota bacterium]